MFIQGRRPLVSVYRHENTIRLSLFNCTILHGELPPRNRLASISFAQGSTGLLFTTECSVYYRKLCRCRGPCLASHASPQRWPDFTRPCDEMNQGVWTEATTPSQSQRPNATTSDSSNKDSEQGK